MDVRCEGCKTDYEFDDVLLSARGTSVKCTKCGNIFRVRPPSGVSEDRWSVGLASGETVEFTALRDLQRAIKNGKVSREDVLTRKGLPARALGQVIELDSLFRRRETLQLTSSDAPPDPSRPSAGPPFSLAPQRSRVDTNPSFPPPDDSVEARAIPAIDRDLAPSDRPLTPAPILGHTPSAAISSQATDPFKLESRTKTKETSSPLPPLSATPPSSETVLPPIGSDALGLAPRKKTSVGGFFVLFIVLSSVGGALLYWSHERASFRAKPAAPAAVVDSRVASFVSEADKALLVGNLEQAKDLLTKANQIAEGDERARVLAVDLAAVQAEVEWLRFRIAKEAAPGDLEGARKALEANAAEANRLADAAHAADKSDADLIRSKAVALFTSGDRENARRWMQRVGTTVAPENAYVLAMLDMSEDTPLWAPVIDRLKSASATIERARAMLVFAAAMSGDEKLAHEQLALMERAEPRHPIFSQVRVLVDARAPMGKGDQKKTADAGSGDSVSAKVAAGRMSTRDLATQVELLRRKNEFGRARELLLSALENNPNDVDVLTMLGQLAQAEHKVPEARGYLGHALNNNGAHLPALLALGDLDWDSGNRSQARKTYTEIVDRFPEGVYPSRVKQRLEVSSPSTPASPPSVPAVPTASAEPAVSTPTASAAPTPPPPAPTPTAGEGAME